MQNDVFICKKDIFGGREVQTIDSQNNAWYMADN